MKKKSILTEKKKQYKNLETGDIETAFKLNSEHSKEPLAVIEHEVCIHYMSVPEFNSKYQLLTTN